MTRTVKHYVEQAQQALAAGFTTKTAQQQAVSDLGRAYDLIKDQLCDAMISEANERFGNREDSWGGDPTGVNARSTWIDEQGYYDLPDYLHNLRDKHLPLLREHEKAVQQLLDLLLDIKAAPINKAPAQPTKQQLEDAAKMTCQCCGRPICANTGVVAHHGYQRPGWGWQTASCEGARELPFEASRDALGRYIERLWALIKSLDDALHNVNQPGAALTVAITDYDTHVTYGRTRKLVLITATAETFEAKCAEYPKSIISCGLPTWERFKVRAQHELQQRLDSVARELQAQQPRYDGWKRTHSWSAAAQEWEQVK
jgi:hypothetical protein